jgi:hypothetical protein
MKDHLFQNLFKPFSIVWAQETTLGGNQWLSESHRFEWQSESNNVDSSLEEDVISPLISEKDEDALAITLVPMQIRTFIVNIQTLE